MRINKKYKLLYDQLNSRRMSVGTFWMEVGTRAISYFCAVLIMTMVLSSVLDLDTVQINRICIYASAALAVLWAIPIIRITRMRLRDAGISVKAYFWLLLPVIGWIVFAVLMCVKGKPQNPETAVEVL